MSSIGRNNRPYRGWRKRPSIRLSFKNRMPLAKQFAQRAEDDKRPIASTNSQIQTPFPFFHVTRRSRKSGSAIRDSGNEPCYCRVLFLSSQRAKILDERACPVELRRHEGGPRPNTRLFQWPLAIAQVGSSC